MTVKDLKKEIENLSDDMKIILQKDGEGNGYSPLAGTDSEAYYIAKNTWSGQVYSSSYSADDNCMEEDEWQKIKDTVPKALILFPVN